MGWDAGFLGQTADGETRAMCKTGPSDLTKEGGHDLESQCVEGDLVAQTKSHTMSIHGKVFELT